MKILFVATEAVPFIKTGGLADVVGALPKALKKKKQDTRIILPLYKSIADKYRDSFEEVMTLNVEVGIISATTTFYQTEVDGIIYYFVEHQGYFERDGLYGYGDDGERFAYFSRAVLEFINASKWKPDLVSLHDWQVGMIPVINRVHFSHVKKLQKMKFVFTIHNLLFQGIFPGEILDSCFQIPYHWYTDGTLRFKDSISYLKAGIMLSDKVTTVSPSYREEILTAYQGEGMQDVLQLRKHDLMGIVNGIDTDLWNPKTDKALAKNYDANSVLRHKSKNKVELQRELGLREDEDVFVIGLVSRLTSQKGLDLICDKLHDLMSQDVQFIVLGSGEHYYESCLRDMENRYRRRAVFYGAYHEELAHRIYAGCDVFLMPSIFEPCGISQLIAMRYGALPLVRETGGLRDTVAPYNQYTNEGTGFSFSQINGDDMMNTIRFAMDTYYYNRDSFNGLIDRAMRQDVSWNTSAELYLGLFKELVPDKVKKSEN